MSTRNTRTSAVDGYGFALVALLGVLLTLVVLVVVGQHLAAEVQSVLDAIRTGGTPGSDLTGTQS